MKPAVERHSETPNEGVSIHMMVIGSGVDRLVLELCEEEVVAPSGITHALDER